MNERAEAMKQAAGRSGDGAFPGSYRLVQICRNLSADGWRDLTGNLTHLKGDIS
ncbi:hypothetical protein [Nitrosospira sp. Nsp18]|uniref:hypothetical protein n=1 Tax=Nitrosospira sp. Nsp18 TaxID=1855334 RepID=UPI0015A2DC4C|nr:hypothetical protein [Nitrosospira sp. Nsp18]